MGLQTPPEICWDWGCCMDSWHCEGLMEKNKKQISNLFSFSPLLLSSLPFFFQVFFMATGGSSNPDMGGLA